jgi:hypothetical protein
VGRNFAKAGSDATGDLTGRIGVGIEQKRGEFVAAETVGQIAGTSIGTQSGGHALQGVIAGKMAEAVVDTLQAVEIEKHQGKRGWLRCARGTSRSRASKNAR